MSEESTSDQNDQAEEIEIIEPEKEGSEEQKEAPAEAEDPTARLKDDLANAQNQLLYMRAEFENYKKQMIKDRSDYLKYGAERLIVDLLNVLDNFDRALESEISVDNADSIESFRKGMELTASEFRATLKRFSVEEVKCEGEAFDPTLHEALSSEETDEVEPGHISRVFKSAYKLHDRLIRPAQVIVAKAKSTDG